VGPSKLEKVTDDSEGESDALDSSENLSSDGCDEGIGDENNEDLKYLHDIHDAELGAFLRETFDEGLENDVHVYF
jgi:hypothetical protein